ncbi:MAG: Ig-like domain repeat protein, partial [Chitinophagaceae bacterium]
MNAKNLIAFATFDDDFDFDFGFSGKIQFGVSLRDKPSDTDQANGIECDNDGTGTSATPYTKPYLSNFTFIGPYDTTGSSALHGLSNRWRRSTRFILRNSLLIGHRKGGFSLESASTATDYKNGESIFKNNVVA